MDNIGLQVIFRKGLFTCSVGHISECGQKYLWYFVKADETEAISSIYGSDWHIESIHDRSYSIKITEGSYAVTVYITLPLDYPSSSPPNIQLSAPNLSRMQKQQIALCLDDIYTENIGEPVIYQCTEKIRECLQKLCYEKPDLVVEETNADEVILKMSTTATNVRASLKTGSTIQDRKSRFQGHVAEVHSVKDVSEVIDCLMENKKIADATHNISAYRICLDKGNILQDCNDDGETHAGRRLLHLLQILDVTNVVVIVSRWYGGINLGPDRFRHINNAAREILEEAGYIAKKK